MKRAALAVVATLVLATPAAASDRALVKTCAQQSFAGFGGAYDDPRNLVVGPLAGVGARAQDYDGAYEGRYRWKMPMLMRPGRRATVRIGAAAAGFARLSFGTGHWNFARSHRRVTFVGCSASKAGSPIGGGRRATFWSGGLTALRTNFCLPLEIRFGTGTIRRRSIPMGPKATCSRDPS